MSITYSDRKDFTKEELACLFLSVGWQSGRYPDKLSIAMKNSATVFSAWEGNRLVGLVNALDDGIMTAYVHFLLVDEAFWGQGIGSGLMEMLTEKYRNYHYIILLSETTQTIPFYERHGFQVLKTSTPMGVKTSGGGC